MKCKMAADQVLKRFSRQIRKEDAVKELHVGAGAILLTEEALTGEGINELLTMLDKQPSWSDLPVVMMMRQGDQSPVATGVLRLLRNVTLLERPAPTLSVVSAVRPRSGVASASTKCATNLSQFAKGKCAQGSSKSNLKSPSTHRSSAPFIAICPSIKSYGTRVAKPTFGCRKMPKSILTFSIPFCTPMTVNAHARR